jgi:chemotaxis protein methyltransferase CheR
MIVSPGEDSFVTWELNPDDVARLVAIVTERSGLAFPESRWPFLRNRAREVVVRSRFTSTRRWLDELELSASSRGALYCDLEEALQIHETSFFRYEDQHRLLGECLLPALVRTGGPRVRIASVGCSTGEEPYSIAMTVRESLSRPGPCPVEIVALDVSRAALTQAVSGTYAEPRVTGVPAPYLGKYFVKAAAGYAVVPALRQMVRFRQHDIRRGFYIGKFDVIVCCNVLLYFTPAMRAAMLARLAESLWAGGYLFLGHAEGVTPSAPFVEARELAAGFVYQRAAEARLMTALGPADVPGGSLRHA